VSITKPCFHRALECKRRDSNLRRNESADLQSALVDRLSTLA